ncbi:hypothetical protein C0584_02215 [Candidatus Parcubacteria bacterium]|nr:MAG: hypothetical protein C0584_02215 [Candidatus Parcubacteria bacterium]
MTETFKQTVNLKDKMEKSQERKRPPVKAKKQEAEIDKVYSQTDSELKKIVRPNNTKTDFNVYKTLSIFLLLIVFGLSAKMLSSLNDDLGDKMTATQYEEKWYSIKLENDETFYGLVGDISADPVVVRNVYYNYDQEKDGGQNESGNLRLVKRGKETHGPDGSINIIRSQIQYLEPLAAESKVLKAIEANEN